MYKIGFRNETGTYLNSDYFEGRKESFICKNHKKQQAKRMKQWGWEKLPDFIKHYASSSDYPNHVRVPAGIASFLEDKFEHKFQYPTSTNVPFNGELREQQKEKVSELMSKRVGLMNASTGVGKGVMIPYVAHAVGGNVLVVVPGKQLLTEMKERFQEWCGITPTTIGGAKQPKKENPNPFVVVSTIDSAVKLEPEYLKRFNLVLLDEADKYVTTESRVKFLWNITAERLYAFTGTLQLNFIDEKVLKIYYGDVVEFIKHNYVPKIYRVKTDFFDEYGEFEDPKEFTKLNGALLSDWRRNELIVDTIEKSIKASSMKKGIVLSNRTEHSYEIARLLEERGIESHVIVGEVKTDDRADIKKRVAEAKNPVVLIGNASILGRGFDLPPLQIAYLTYPCRFDANVIQACGRVIRPYEGKTYCEVYDFVDENVRMLKNQGRIRQEAMRKEYKNPSITDIPWKK